MLDKLSKLTKKQVTKVHRLYIDEFQSLSDTAQHLEQYQIKINRHQLSRAFKLRDLKVLPPNGRSIGDWRVLSKFRSPQSEFASAMVEQAVKDVRDYQKKGMGKIHFLSACYFFGHRFYPLLVGAITYAADRPMLNVLPVGVTEEVVRVGSALYEDQYAFWVGK